MRRCLANRDLVDLVDGDLSWERRTRLEEHADRCPKCARRLQQFHGAEEVLLELPSPSLTDLDRVRLRAGVRERLAHPEEEDPAEPWPLPSRPARRLAPWYAAAAAGLLGVTVWATWPTEPPSSGVNAPTEVAHGDDAPVVIAPETGAAQPLPPTPEHLAAVAQERAASERRMAEQDRSIDDALRTLPPRGAVATLFARRLGVALEPRTLADRLAQRLTGEDDLLAHTASRVLREQLSESPETPVSPDALRALELALAEPTRAADALAVLRRIDHPSAHRAAHRLLMASLDRPALRRTACLELTVRLGRGLDDEFTSWLAALAESPRGEDATLLADALRRLPCTSPDVLPTLVALTRSKAPAPLLAGAVQRLSPDAIVALIDGLTERGIVHSRDAVALASFSTDTRFVAPLERLARAGRDDAFDALGAMPHPLALACLVELHGDSTLSRARRTQAGTAFTAAMERLDHSAPIVLDVIHTRRDTRALLSLVSTFPTEAADAVLRAWMHDEASTPLQRASASVAWAAQSPHADTATLVQLLQAVDAAPTDAEPEQRQLWIGALLAGLHLVGGDVALNQGLVTLDLTWQRGTESTFAQRADQVARRVGTLEFSSTLHRLADLLGDG